MALPDIFSRRKRQASLSTTDIYVYDEIPSKVRVQIVQIIEETVGPFHTYNGEPGRVYTGIVELLRKEFGVFKLVKSYDEDTSAELYNWFLNEKEIDKLLDGLEVTFRIVENYIGEDNYNFSSSKAKPSAAIKELNARLQEAAVGYQYESQRIVRVDSQFAHSEIVVPTLHLLSKKIYAAANNEYISAHDAFRHRDYETCLVECAKAFESTLKVIGKKRGWPISENDAAKKLLDAAYQAEFVPPYLQAEFTSLRSLLESAVPTVRNRMGGHGAGALPRTVPSHLAAFQLHQTGAAILFLARHDAEQ